MGSATSHTPDRSVTAAYVAWAKGTDDLVGAVAEVVGDRSATVPYELAVALDRLAGTRGRRIRTEEHVAGLLAALGEEERGDLVEAAMAVVDPRSRPNATPWRLAVLAGTGLLPGADPAAGRAVAVMERALAPAIVRQTPDVVPLGVLGHLWLRSGAIVHREWKGNRFGPLPLWVARRLADPTGGDRADGLLELAAVWSARLGADLVSALAELVRSPFPERPPTGLDDPFAVAARLIGEPLGYDDAALLELRLLARDVRPPPDLVARLARLLELYPSRLQSPLHAAVALGAAEAPGAMPLAREVLHKLFATSITALNKETKARGMLVSAQMTGRSVDLLASHCVNAVTGRCRCGHHDWRLYRCRARRNGFGTVCLSRCCRHSLRPWLEPVADIDKLEPLGWAVVRMLYGRGDAELQGDDLQRGLLLDGLIFLGIRLEWRTHRNLVSFKVMSGPVLFEECSCGALFEGPGCVNCDSRVTPTRGSLVVKDKWVFARGVPGWFGYEKETVFGCGGVGCERYFRADRLGTACRCGRLRRNLGRGRRVWVKHFMREDPSGDLGALPA